MPADFEIPCQTKTLPAINEARQSLGPQTIYDNLIIFMANQASFYCEFIHSKTSDPNNTLLSHFLTFIDGKNNRHTINRPGDDFEMNMHDSGINNAHLFLQKAEDGKEIIVCDLISHAPNSQTKAYQNSLHLVRPV